MPSSGFFYLAFYLTESHNAVMSHRVCVYVQFINDIDNLKNNTHCIALCEMK